MSFDWKKALKTIAPSLATALGGPAAGAATAALGKALLGKDDATEEEIAARVETWTPEQQIALKRADQEFALEMMRIAQADSTLEVQDRVSAREMQKAVHSTTPDVISYLIIAMFAAELVASHFFPVPVANHDMASQVAGVLNISMGTVLGFWLGGSLNSRAKDVTIARALEKH